MAARTKKIVIPFNAGMREDIDPKLLPDGLFALITNMRYRKDGRLGLRNGYVTVPLDVDSGLLTLAPFDLHALGNRVVARGNSWGDGFPTNLYELVEHSSATWREVSGLDTVATVCAFQDAKHLVGVAQPAGGATRNQVAACNGYVATVVMYTDLVLGAQASVTVQRESGAIVFGGTFSAATGRARICTVATGTGSNRAFVFVAENTATARAEAWVYDPNVNTTSLLTSLGPLHTADGAVRCFDVAEVVGAAHFVFAVSTATGNQVRIFRYSLAGVQQGATITVAATNVPNTLAVEADNAASNLSLLVVTSAPAVALRTITFAGAVTGPTALFGGSNLLTTVDDQCRIVRVPAVAASGTVARVFCVVSIQPPTSGGLQVRLSDVGYDFRSIAAHVSSGAAFFRDCLVDGHVLSLQSVGTPGREHSLCLSVSVGELKTGIGSRTTCLILKDQFGDQSMPVNEIIAISAEGSASYDVSTGRVWFSSFYAGAASDTTKSPRITGVLVNSTAPISSAPIAGALAFAGGAPMIWDGSGAPRELGFASIPGIRTAVSSAGAGLLTLLGQYDYVATWSRVNAQGEIERSPPSSVTTVIMTGANNQNAFDIQGPRSLLAVLAGYTRPGSGTTIELWRTVWDATNSVKIAGFRKCSTTVCLGTGAGTGFTTLCADILSDAILATQELLYTDAGSGALSGPLPRVNAPAAAFVNTVGARLQLSGLPDRQRYCESLAKLPGRPVCFAPNARTGASYYNDAQLAIAGAASTDAGRVLFTDKEILIAGGKGADEDGRGQIPEAVRLSGDFSLRANGQRSILVAKEGVWFQADDEKLCLLPLDGGPAKWEGQPIRTTLKARPAIAAAAQCQNENTALFAINSAFSGRILVREQRTGQWSQDQLALAPIVSAVVPQNGTVVLLGSNGVKRYSPTGFADDVSSAITAQALTGWFSSAGLGGWQQVCSLVLGLEWRGDCQVSLFMLRDTTANLALINTFTLSGLTVGSYHDLEFKPKQGKCSRFQLLIQVVPTTATDSVILNSLTLEVLPFAGPVRLPRARRA